VNQSEIIKLRLWEIGGTEKAYLFSSTPKDGRDGNKVWIPKSQIEHITRQAPKVNEWRECVVSLPLWIAERNGLA
jgi:hypothetical protein